MRAPLPVLASATGMEIQGAVVVACQPQEPPVVTRTSPATWLQSNDWCVADSVRPHAETTALTSIE